MDQGPIEEKMDQPSHEIKSLGELEYASETLRRLMQTVELNLELNEEAETVRKCLSTAHLWLRQAIKEQHGRIERRKKDHS